MSETQNALATVQDNKSLVAIGRNGIQLTNMDELFRFSKAVSASGFAPKGMEKPESIFVAVQLGLELGLSPMAALQNIGVINGRPGIYGDAALALVRASGLLKSYSEKMDGSGDNQKCIVKSVRVDGGEIESEFSVEDAKRAGLWGRQGPWSQYPTRMLKFRARGFNLRDNFGDVLKGLRTTEELEDTPESRFEKAKPVFGRVKEDKSDAKEEKSETVQGFDKAETTTESNSSSDSKKESSSRLEELEKMMADNCVKGIVNALRQCDQLPKRSTTIQNINDLSDEKIEWAIANFDQLIPHMEAA